MELAILGAPGIGAPEVILIILVLILLFGAKKLPEVARGSGRALRIFKAETKGLMNDDEDQDEVPPARPQPPQVHTQALPPKEPIAPARPEEDPARPETDR